MLIHFDPAATDETHILATVHSLSLEPREAAAPAAVAGPAASSAQRGGNPFLRADPPPRHRAGPARGRAADAIMYDADSVQPLIEQLARQPGVWVRADPRTQRVQVEFDAREGTIGHLLAQVIALASTERSAADRPVRPGGPVPLRPRGVQAREATPPVWLLPVDEGAPGATSSVMRRVEQSFAAGDPADGSALWRRRLGTLPVLDLLCSASGLVGAAASLVSVARASSPLGLLLAGAELVHVCTALLARHTARQRDEARRNARVTTAPSIALTLEAGESAPLALAAPQAAGPGGAALRAPRSRATPH